MARPLLEAGFEVSRRGRLPRPGLHPGGLLVFDVVTEAHGRPEGRVSWREDPCRGWCVGVRVDEGPARRLVRRRITTFRRVGRSYRRTDEVHVQRRLDRARIGASLRAAGFRAREIRGYGAARFRPGCAGFVAEKPFAS